MTLNKYSCLVVLWRLADFHDFNVENITKPVFQAIPLFEYVQKILQNKYDRSCNSLQDNELPRFEYIEKKLFSIFFSMELFTPEITLLSRMQVGKHHIQFKSRVLSVSF